MSTGMGSALRCREQKPHIPRKAATAGSPNSTERLAAHDHDVDFGIAGQRGKREPGDSVADQSDSFLFMIALCTDAGIRVPRAARDLLVPSLSADSTTVEIMSNASKRGDPLKTEPGWGMHTGAEIGIDEFQASRSPDKRYRTTPLRGLWAHPKSGYYHDGRFATLLDVVNHYDATFTLGLANGQKSDLVEYLKSL